MENTTPNDARLPTLVVPQWSALPCLVAILLFFDPSDVLSFCFSSSLCPPPPTSSPTSSPTSTQAETTQLCYFGVFAPQNQHTLSFHFFGSPHLGDILSVTVLLPQTLPRRNLRRLSERSSSHQQSKAQQHNTTTPRSRTRKSTPSSYLLILPKCSPTLLLEAHEALLVAGDQMEYKSAGQVVQDQELIEMEI